MPNMNEGYVSPSKYGHVRFRRSWNPDMSQMFGGGLKGKIGEFATKQAMKCMANKMKKLRKTEINKRKNKSLNLKERLVFV